MLDWLRRKPSEPPSLTLGGQTLPIILRRLPQAKRLTLRLSPDGREIRLSMPTWARTEEALAFAQSRAEWLTAQLARHAAPQTIAHGTLIPYRGLPHRLHHAPGQPRRIHATEDRTLHMGGPAEGLPTRLQRWMQAQAREAFAADLAHYCARAGVPVPALALSSAKARWGSCSSRGVVRLNWRLIMAPDAVRRSVVAHEVAHLIHFNHSPAFHALLAALFEGDVEEANRWLIRHGRSLYALNG
jgi:predicted metal-dependent hydrolase